MRNSNRHRLMRKLQEECFALYDVKLYLDTHPTDQKAIEYFKKHRSMYDKAVQEYVAEYGPIKANQVSGNTWSWVEKPWPWEMED